jgi:hypothetical protein
MKSYGKASLPGINLDKAKVILALESVFGNDEMQLNTQGCMPSHAI